MMTKTRKRSGRILLDCSLIRFAVLPDNRRPEKLKAQKLDDQLGDADEEKDKAALEPDVDEGEVGGLGNDGVDSMLMVVIVIRLVKWMLYWAAMPLALVGKYMVTQARKTKRNEGQ